MPNYNYHPKKLVCKRGHEIALVGRDRKGRCRECLRKTYKPVVVDKRKKQFCPKGHDTFICGRTKSQGCKQCAKDSQISRRVGPKPPKLFCVHGHEYAITGKDKWGHCRQCQRDYDRKRRLPTNRQRLRPKKQFCKHGHDIFVVGRDNDGHCNGCRKQTRHKRYLNTKEKEIAYSRMYAKTHREQVNKAVRELMKANPERRRKYALKHINKVDPELYDKLLKEQNYSCAICKTIQPHKNAKKKYFCLDHDHSTGKKRGLLCDNCNKGLGQFKDNIEALKNAVEYLIMHKEINND